MKNKLRIALVQMFCEKGAIDENLAVMSAYIDQAERRSIDIIGFPENSLTGHNDPPKSDREMILLDGDEVNDLLKMTDGKNPTILAGLVEKNPAGKPFITQIVVRDGKLIGCHRKINVGEYEGEIKEPYTPGDRIDVFDHDGLTFGVAVCADISVEHIFAEYARQGAEIIFELAAPGLYGDRATRDWHSGYEMWEKACMDTFSGYSTRHGIWIAVATQAGRTSDEDFPGGGYLFNPRGERVYSTKDWNPCVSYLEIDLDSGKVTSIP
jgi:predicted amidohydrolase